MASFVQYNWTELLQTFLSSSALWNLKLSNFGSQTDWQKGSQSDMASIYQQKMKVLLYLTLERLRNENEDKKKPHDWIDLEYFGSKS